MQFCKGMLTLSYRYFALTPQNLPIQIQFLLILIDLLPLILAEGHSMSNNFGHQRHKFPLVSLDFLCFTVFWVYYLPIWTLDEGRIDQVVRILNFNALNVLSFRVVRYFVKEFRSDILWMCKNLLFSSEFFIELLFLFCLTNLWILYLPLNVLQANWFI